jgi:DNA polymerase
MNDARAELHRLVLDMRARLEAELYGGMPGSMPATTEARAEFEARQAKRRAQKASALREQITGSASPKMVPGIQKTAPNRSDEMVPGIQKTAPNRSDEMVPGIQKTAQTQDDTKVPGKPRGAGVPIWEEFGSKPTPIFEAPKEVNLWDASASHEDRLKALRAHIGDCKRCGLCDTRTNIVFGEGSPQARLMFIGEGPGMNEDLQGRPFVGKAGELLERMIKAMGYDRSEVYIANVVKCRPPENRDPAPDEIAKCSPFIRKQIEAIEPEVIVTLGKFGANTLLKREGSLTQIRGQWQEYEGIRVMPTFHPAYLLRSPDAKRDAWADLQLVMKKLQS